MTWLMGPQIKMDSDPLTVLQKAGRAGEMAQHLKVLAANPQDPCTGKKNSSYKLPSNHTLWHIFKSPFLPQSN